MQWWARLLRRNRVEAQLESRASRSSRAPGCRSHRGGPDRTEARRRAHLEFGGRIRSKSLCRDARGTRWLADLAQDYSIRRSLFRAQPPPLRSRRSRLHGARHRRQYSIFTLVDATMLKALPVHEPNGSRAADKTINNPPGNAFSYQRWSTARAREHRGRHCKATIPNSLSS